jgi:hypothetical protein
LSSRVRTTERAPRTFRGARSAWAGVAALALVAAAAVVWTNRVQDRGRAAAPDTEPSSTLHPACETPPVRERCAAVEAGGRTTRYALLRADTPTPDTIFVDLGGPGIAALSGQFALSGFRDSLGSTGTRFNMLVVEEPWVRRPVPNACRSALTAFYRAVRTDSASRARANELVRSCALGAEPHRWGHSPAAFREAVTAIARGERLTLRGVVAASFGSVRWEHLAAAPVAATVGWVVLVRPFPLGERGTDLIAARAAAVTRSTGRVVALAGEHPIATRSVPVTLFDQLSAQIEVAYQSNPADQRAVATGRDLTRIAHLSDVLWLRYGADQLTAGYLAYLDEVCDVGGAWPPIQPTRSVTGVLAASHLPCPSGSPPAPRPAPPRQPTCIVSSPNDAVTPAPLIHRSYARLPHIQFVQAATAAHGSTDGMNKCLQNVGAT